jgi:hypothetical protein
VLVIALVVVSIFMGDPAWFRWGIQTPPGLAAVDVAGAWFVSRHREIQASETDVLSLRPRRT